jgi:hypothetical protein
MEKKSIAYASWRWNQRFSSKGIHRTLGRIHLIIVRQTGRRISIPSKLRTKPAPLEIQTEYISVFRGANRGSDSCLYLHHGELALRESTDTA